MARQRRYRHSGNPREEFSRRINEVKEAIALYKGQCLFLAGDGGLCQGTPVNCHVIPRKSVLANLQDKSGEVLEFDWNVGPWGHFWITGSQPGDLNNPASFKPQKVSIGIACSGLSGCNPHDHGVFCPLDTNAPDFDDMNVRLLAVGRPKLYAADRVGMLRFVGARLNDRIIKRNRGRQITEWRMEKARLDAAYKRAHLQVARWLSVWQSAHSGSTFHEDLVQWQPLTFRSTLTFAASAMYADGLTVMVVPGDGDVHKANMLYYKDNSETVGERRERLTQRARYTEENDDYGVSMILELMSAGESSAPRTEDLAVVAASNHSYQALQDEERETIQRIVMGAIGAKEVRRLIGNL